MDILSVYGSLNPAEKKLLHMAFDEGTYELVRLGDERLDTEGNEVFISVNHVENQEFFPIETKNHWTVGRINK